MVRSSLHETKNDDGWLVKMLRLSGQQGQVHNGEQLTSEQIHAHNQAIIEHFVNGTGPFSDFAPPLQARPNSHY